MAQQRYLLICLAVLLASTTAVLGRMECEELPIEFCAFSVSSTGAHCVLETNVKRDGSIDYECQTSVVMAEQVVDWIETDECIDACGLDRMSVGMSTDALVQRTFTQTLCSAACRYNCPNVFALFTKLASGEGVYLPQVCEAQSSNRRFMGEVFASLSKDTITPELSPAPAPAAN